MIPRKNIAVIGAGVAGITASYYLSKAHAVTLFEKNDYLGGHTNTVEVEDEEGKLLPIDTGFIVCNPVNYPRFYAFLEELEIELRDSDMSFGYSAEGQGPSYVGPSILEFVSHPSNFLSPAFLKMIWEQTRFNSKTLRALNQGSLEQISLGQHIENLSCSQYLIDHYLVPVSAAIWSSPDHDIHAFPAKTFATFFRNHGMLEFHKRPQWQTVVGGSYSYVKKFSSVFSGTAYTKDPVQHVTRNGDGVQVRTASQSLEFDAVVFSCHADEALRLLGDPGKDEKKLLGSWNYHENSAVLHTDTSLLPKNRKLWASWNYRRPATWDTASPVAVSYYMNRLQGLDTKTDFLVSLNCENRIAKNAVRYSTRYTHPAYTTESVASQSGLRSLNGARKTYYCGSYMGYGFHEDAVSSAIDVCEQLGVLQ